MDNIVKKIERKSNGNTTIVYGDITEGCIFENTLVGIGTLIIDKDFINEMIKIAQGVIVEGNFINLLSRFNSQVNDYFYTRESSEIKRENVYSDNLVIDDEGMIIGTKISSLKGKNIALCSEKSLAMYIILKYLYENKIITRSPSLMLSNLETEINPENIEPHAFLMIDKETDNYPFKHILFDVQNPTEVEDQDKNKHLFTGLYALSDEEKENVVNGYKCSPSSLYELLGNYHEVGVKRIYGSKDKNLKQNVSFI